MALKGDLSTIGLGEVFQMISMSQKEGTLVVEDGESRKAIYFGKEGVQLLSTGRRKGFRIGDILVRAGKISQEKLKEVLDRQKTSRRLLGEELVNSGHVTRKDIQEVVRAQIEEEIYDLFLWKRAGFEFIEGPPVEELRDPESHVIRLSFDLNMLLLEAVRRTDEWTRINLKIQGMDCVFEFVEADQRERELAGANAEGMAILERLDGYTSIHDIIEATLRPRFEVCHLILELMERGSIRLVQLSGMVEKARQLLAEGDQERGLRLFNAAALMDPEDVDVMSGFAHALETQGLLQDAARVYVRIGTQLESMGRAQEGVAYFQRAVALVPNDPQSKIALFGVSLAGGNIEEALQTARDLVTSSLASKDFETARTVAEKGVAAAPHDISMRIALAKAYYGLGLKSQCDEVVKHIHKNLPVDQGEAGRILAELQAVIIPSPITLAIRAAAARRRGRKRLYKPTVVLAIALVALWVGYEIMAATACSRQTLEAKSLQERGKLDEAQALMAEFNEGLYRFSLLSASKARALQTEIEEEIRNKKKPVVDRTPVKDPKEIEKERLAEEKRKQEARLKQLEEEVDQFKGLGEMGKALQSAQELARLAEQLKDQTRLSFARSREREIARYQDAAAGLRDEAAKLETEGSFKEAAEKIAQIFRVYPFSDAARTVTYPLVLKVNIADVEVQRDGRTVEVSAGKDITIRLKKEDKPFQLSFQKKGYREKKVDVLSLTMGLIELRMDERVPEWQFPLGAALAWPPIVDGGMVYVRTKERIIALAMENRELRWSVKLEGSASGSLRLVDGLLYAPIGKAVVVIDPTKPDGKNVVRQMTVDQPIVGTLGFSAARDVIYFGTGDRGLVALHAQTGAVVWRRTFPREVVAEPLEFNGLVLVACRDGYVYAVRGAEQGDPDVNLAWKSPRLGELASAPRIHEGMGYVGTGDGRIAALDLATGKAAWSVSVGPSVTSTPELASGRLLVSTLGGQLVAVDLGSREVAWTYRTDGPLRSSAVPGPGYFLVGSEDRWLHAVTTEGARLWRCMTGARIVASPAVAEGKAYFGSDDQILYAVPLE